MTSVHDDVGVVAITVPLVSSTAMGLYDEILCESPLPGWPDGAEPVFQTKDLDCCMERYRISQAGRLLTTRYQRGEATPTRELDTGYHGNLVFYTSTARGSPTGRSSSCSGSQRASRAAESA